MSSSPEVDSMPNILQAAEAPLNYFLHSYGPAAEPIMYLGWVLAGLSVTIILIMGTFWPRQSCVSGPLKIPRLSAPKVEDCVGSILERDSRPVSFLDLLSIL